jgi:hypothetical protein
MARANTITTFTAGPREKNDGCFSPTRFTGLLCWIPPVTRIARLWNLHQDLVGVNVLLLSRKALANARRALGNPEICVVPRSNDSFLSGMALYGARLDKGYSLTDCISIQAMRRRFDKRIEQRKHFGQPVNLTSR